MPGPISPKDVIKAKQRDIPEFVFEVINQLIVENIDGNEAKVRQDEIVNRLVVNHDVERSDIFKKGWLNIEDIYRKAGWKVTYDKAGYCETYSSFFLFTKRATRGT